MPRLDYVFKPGERGPSELFWVFYFIATGLHAIHLSIGIVLVLIMAVARPPRRLLARLLCAARGGRALLELRRHRLGLPVRRHLPARAGRRMSAAGASARRCGPTSSPGRCSSCSSA